MDYEAYWFVWFFKLLVSKHRRTSLKKPFNLPFKKPGVWKDYGSLFLFHSYFQQRDVHENQVPVSSTVGYIQDSIPSPVLTLLMLRQGFAESHVIHYNLSSTTQLQKKYLFYDTLSTRDAKSALPVC